MRLFEYEVKGLFQDIGIRIPEGEVVVDPDQAVQVADKLGGEVVLKAQVLTGKRQKSGAVRFADSSSAVRQIAEEIFDLSVDGWPVKKILVEQKVNIERELYLAASIDSFGMNPILIAGQEGGIDVEEAGNQSPDNISIQAVDILSGLSQFQPINLFSDFGFTGKQLLNISNITLRLYQLFSARYAKLVEINPLVLTTENKIMALDAKMELDQNAMDFWGGFAIGRDRYQHQLEYEAAQQGLKYVKLNGNIGLACTGAGLTLSTLDMINESGGQAANFLEFGGATYGNSYHALRIILSDPDVRVILINTFGLVARADIIAEGLIEAIHNLQPKIPIVAAIRGTGHERAHQLLQGEADIVAFQSTREVVEAALNITRGLD